MNYKISKEADGGFFYLEEAHILRVNPLRGSDYAVSIWLQARNVYKENASLTWDGKHWRADLLPRQVREMIEQNREAQESFCSPCYDYGGLSAPPADCTRCLLLDACRKSGGGDYRKSKKEFPQKPGAGYGVAMISLVLFSVTCLQLSGKAYLHAEDLAGRLYDARRDTEAARAALSACRRKEPGFTIKYVRMRKPADSPGR